jgi:histidinol-phosphate aminotransferase
MEAESKEIFKAHIASITPYEPGKPIEEVERELGLRRVIKLASNENPLGTSKKVVKALRKAAARVYLYPDGGSYYLTKALAAKLGVRESEIILGNGSNEIIEFLVKGFVGEGDKVISSEKSFLVYPLVTRTAGGIFVEAPMKDYRYDLKAIAERVDARTRLIFIANPNNPTGTYVTREEMTEFLARVPEDVIVGIDEAYSEFVEAKDFPDGLFYAKLEKPNVISLRTFSKSHGLAGLRIGYGVACEPLIQYLHKIRQPFNVNSLAQCAALAALEDADYVNRAREIIREGRKYLYREFEKMGLGWVPSQANFVLVDTGFEGEKVCQALLGRGVIVRSMRPYGLFRHVRVTVGLPKHNRRFVRELKRILRSFRKAGGIA